MSDAYTVAVLGGGSFGTVIGNIIACNGHTVRLWLRNPARAEEINCHHENSAYLPGYRLDTQLGATCLLAEAVSDVDIVFVAVPSKSFRDVVRELASLLPEQTIVISLTKGIEPGGFRLMSEILRQELPENPRGVLSGPNLAREIAAGQVAGSVIASELPSTNTLIHEAQTFVDQAKSLEASTERDSLKLLNQYKQSLTIYIGRFAQQAYLSQYKTLTEAIFAWDSLLPDCFFSGQVCDGKHTCKHRLS